MKRNEKVKIYCKKGITVGTILSVTSSQVKMKSPKMGIISVNKERVIELREPYRNAIYIYHSFN